MTQTDTDVQTVFVQSLWHRDCDPFVTVVGKDRETVKRLLIDESSKDEWERLLDDSVCAECSEPPEDITPEDGEYVCQCGHEGVVEDTIMTGGIFQETLDSMELNAEELADLDRDGYCFVSR